MRVKRTVISVLGILLYLFKVLLGALTTLAGLGCLMVENIGAGGRFHWEFLIAACLPVAGFCFLLGVCIPRWTRVEAMPSMINLALAILFGLVFMLVVGLFAAFDAEPRLRRATLVFLALFPGCVVMFGAVEIAVFCITDRWRQRTPVAGGDAQRKPEDPVSSSETRLSA
jgi:hypothetical protein